MKKMSVNNRQGKIITFSERGRGKRGRFLSKTDYKNHAINTELVRKS